MFSEQEEGLFTELNERRANLERKYLSYSEMDLVLVYLRSCYHWNRAFSSINILVNAVKSS